MLGGAAAARTQSVTQDGVSIGFKADTGPLRSECGVGALMPWADSLWLVTYNSHKRGTGTGLALYRIDESLKTEKVHVHDGTHANRLVHSQSNQMFIGPYAIDMKGNFRFIEQLKDDRLTATIPHLTDPANRVYMLSMEGLLYDLDVSTLKATLIIDLVKQFGIKDRPHFKGGCRGQGRIVVSNNGFYEYGDMQAGLFEWDGKDWRAIYRKPHMDCASREDMGNVVFCSGWDERSVLFWALIKGTWHRYRLPKASHSFEHAYQTEWMRIREVETEHFLMDIQGAFYELQPIAFQGAIWGVKPICSHLRTIPDYCSFRGMFVVGGNETTPNHDNYLVAGQPQSGIWIGKTDDLWRWGKASGWGGVWRKTAVQAGEASDPYLMTGFDKKVLHLISDKGDAEVDIEVDPLGSGEWQRMERIKLNGTYKYFVFPEGFSAQWVRLVSRTAQTITGEFIYT